MRRSVFLSTFLFAAVLSPITLNSFTCVPPADARLAVLELRVGDFHGENVIEGFSPNVFSYDVRFPEEESVGVLWVRANHPSANVDVLYNGLPVRLFAQSVAKLDVPLGPSELTIEVSTRGPKPDFKTYVIRIERVPIFPCAEQGIRDAIARGGGPIYFDCDEPTTVLTEAEIVIDNDVILDGEGNLIVDAGSADPKAAGEVAPKINGAHRVFSIPEGVTAELIGFTVTGGSTDGDGGGILNLGMFTLRNSTVSKNSADRGGGVASLPPGTLTVVASTVSGNTANLAAGIGTAGPAEIIDTTVSNNSALASGGGVGIAMGGNLTLTGSAVEGNHSAQAAGGIGSETNTTMTLNTTTVANNESGAQGGGVLNAGEATLNDCTVVGNSATNFNGGIGNGGVLTLNNTTVANNSVIGDGGGIGSNGVMTLRNSIVSGNSATGYSGGIGNSGELTLIDSTVSGNSCGLDGGGIASFSGTMTLTNTTVSGNTAGPSGGGVLNYSEAILVDSTLIANTAGHYAGLNNGGMATLTRTRLEGNHATSGSGGGIGNGGTITLIETTVAGNQVRWHGGGIAQWGTMALISSTVSGNTAVYGGGIWNFGGSLALTNSSVSGNSATEASGGGIANEASITLISSTFAANSAADTGSTAIWNTGVALSRNTLIAGECGFTSPFDSFGGNTESPGNTCGLDQPTDLVNVPAAALNLGPLADNGGPTATHALLPGSVAIDWVPIGECVDANGDPLLTDQRGVARPQGPACDVGAFEAEPGGGGAVPLKLGTYTFTCIPSGLPIPLPVEIAIHAQDPGFFEGVPAVLTSQLGYIVAPAVLDLLPALAPDAVIDNVDTTVGVAGGVPTSITFDETAAPYTLPFPPVGQFDSTYVMTEITPNFGASVIALSVDAFTTTISGIPESLIPGGALTLTAGEGDCGDLEPLPNGGGGSGGIGGTGGTSGAGGVGGAP